MQIVVDKCRFCGMAYLGLLPEGFETIAQKFLEFPHVQENLTETNNLDICPPCIEHEVRHFEETQTSFLWGEEND